MRQVTPYGHAPMEAGVGSMALHRPLTVDSSWPARMEPGHPIPRLICSSIRADADGDTLWTRLFDTPSSPPPFGSWSFVRFIRATSGGGCIIGGGVASVFVGTGSPFLLKLTADGTLSWSNYYAFLQVHDLRITADGDLLVLGTETDQLWYYTSLERITATGDPAQSSPILPNQPRSQQPVYPRR